MKAIPRAHCVPSWQMEPAEASWGFLREEPSAKAKSQPLRQGAEACPGRGLFGDAVVPNWEVEIATEKGKEEEQGTRKVGQPSGPRRRAEWAPVRGPAQACCPECDHVRGGGGVRARARVISVTLSPGEHRQGCEAMLRVGVPPRAAPNPCPPSSLHFPQISVRCALMFHAWERSPLGPTRQEGGDFCGRGMFSCVCFFSPISKVGLLPGTAWPTRMPQTDTPLLNSKSPPDTSACAKSLGRGCAFPWSSLLLALHT